MKRIRAGIAQFAQSPKIREYNRRKKEGLCVSCGNPAAILDDRAAIVLCRGQYVVERGRRASRCTGCADREKAARSLKLTLKSCRTISQGIPATSAAPWSGRA